MRFAWPLTGRSEEMLAIEAAIASPDVFGIVVSGAAGVGKSRIVREALNAAVSNDCEVRWVVATSSAKSLPLGAFASWAESAFTDSLQLVRGVIDSLTAAPPGTRVVVGVDDAHLLDDLSAFVLHQIVQREAAKVVVTIRDGEPVPAAVRDLWKGGHFERLDLQPLAMEETTMLLSSALPGPVDPDAVHRMWKLTRGNVLYLRNIVEQEIGDGRLANNKGYWRWTGDPVVPPGLAELIDARMGALPDTRVSGHRRRPPERVRARGPGGRQPRCGGDVATALRGLSESSARSGQCRGFGSRRPRRWAPRRGAGLVEPDR